MILVSPHDFLSSVLSAVGPAEVEGPAKEDARKKRKWPLTKPI
jgi:hypothetical protein